MNTKEQLLNEIERLSGAHHGQCVCGSEKTLKQIQAELGDDVIRRSWG